MTKITFEALTAEVERADIKHGSVLDRVDDILDKARQNAYDTCYVEQAAALDRYDEIALATVCCLLADSTDKLVKRWFAKRGVEG
jgi:hypothetical protein